VDLDRPAVNPVFPACVDLDRVLAILDGMIIVCIAIMVLGLIMVDDTTTRLSVAIVIVSLTIYLLMSGEVIRLK